MRLLNKKFARKTAAAALVLATAATLATGAFAAEDDGVVAGYTPPQEVMVQGDIALHSADVAVGRGWTPTTAAMPPRRATPFRATIMLISAGDLDTPLPSDTQVERRRPTTPSRACWAKQVLYTARQEGSVLTLDFPENVATFRATILDLQTLMNDGVSTVVLQTNKTSTTLNLSLLCDGYSANDKVVLRHIGSRACLTVQGPQPPRPPHRPLRSPFFKSFLSFQFPESDQKSSAPQGSSCRGRCSVSIGFLR